ncbi:hypothetical protein J2Y45_001942 [Dyadobacter sp. BE34]|uniref:DUF5618 domain-containing protein n=1 Tax=Dyadobacter fermentans TaxID=94254 RepID=A0ABU1QYL0_9BACT|nr:MULTISPECIES: DUF5618 family protein [Dyadobacter]MDR6805749.1 hypothetical protein [Dyadobacter fermentans]MDR7042491.1 hypothetical protein [Dyadobacter sp. BE242]MDR7196803.1 hypothetical protein [Dyadobacter sp. BE34]MDR7215762.1 hypothetical protein [Dyadobacter sp. BE31]MDR7263298.1 hypothetical protein [Dyadobacter sp. BE32]
MATKDPISEAKRYVENARTILREKAVKEDDLYSDRKYVKLAGHAAYTGVLLALDGLFGIKSKGRKDINWYRDQVARTDKKLLTNFMSAYELLHLSMSYDGNREVSTAQSGLKRADEIIHWVEQRTTTC